MKTTLAISVTAGILHRASRTSATTTSGVDAFYDNLDCTGVPVLVRLYPSCENSNTEVEAVCDSYDSRKNFCVPNEAEYFGETNPYVVIESYDDANCLEVGRMTHAYLADGRCHEYMIDEHGAAYTQLTTVDEGGMVTIYPGCNTSETPEFQQPATSFNTDGCVPVDDNGYSKLYLVNIDTSGDASGSTGTIYTPPATNVNASGSASATDTHSTASGSTSATADTPSATTAAPTTTTTGSASLATSTPILCSIAILLVSTVLSTLAAF